MPLPGDLTTITVTATYSDGTGAPLYGYITFTPSTDLTDSTGRVILRAAPIVANLVKGAISVTLICTDNATVSPSGWSWAVNEVVGTAAGNLVPRSYNVLLPHTLGASTDLSTLAPVIPQASVTPYLLASNNLSDLVSIPTSRTNLGLGGAALLNVGTASGTVAAGNDSRITGALQAANNFSDVASAVTARINLSAPAAFPLKSTWWYPQDGGGGNETLVYQQIELWPFDFLRPQTITTLAINVKTGGVAGSTIRLGIYNSDGAGLVGTPLLDAGTVTGASTGVQSIGSLSTPVNPGRYWFGAVYQGTNGAAPQVQGYSRALPYLGWSSYQQFPSVIAYQWTGITGALPASLGSPTGFQNNQAPAVQFAVA